MTNGARGSVLLVEDHQDLAGTVGDFLDARGYLVDLAADGLLGMHLGLRDGAQLTPPIIMLTARDRLDDKLSGFEVGADDYLVKPFALPELAARIEALIRRGRGIASSYALDDLSMNVDTMEVRREDIEIRLSRTLFDILRILMREAPKVVPRETIERELWGDDLPDSNTLRSHLYNLRRAADKPFDHPMIETLAGRGYRIRSRTGNPASATG